MSADRRSTRILTRAATGAALTACTAGLVLASPVGAAAAGDGPAIVTNRETVQVDLKSSGAVDTARLFSQLVIDADGKAIVLDPTSGKNIRDLDGFSPPEVKNGVARYVVDVHGRTNRRTVSDFTRRLPLKVQAEYFLDGKRKSAGDLVGKSGVLDVKYTVKNVSATPTEISYTVAGKKTTKTVDLVTPMVGQLTTTLPSSFTDIDTPRADIAGDGRGGQQLNWTMVLFEPIGAVTQTFGYTARVKDLHLPAARIQAVPVSPNRHPELAFGEKGFVSGAASGGDVAFAGAVISTNLLKLSVGVGQLLDGLTQLTAGAVALNEGLAGTAVPGAQKLSDGLGTANAGSAKLATGSQTLASGADLAAAGAAQLNTGLKQISAGLDALASTTTGLPAARAGAVALRAGVDKLFAGTQALGAGLTSLSKGVTQFGNQVKLGLDNPAGVSGSTTNPPGIKQAVEGLQKLSGIQQLVLTTGIPAGALAPGSPAVPGVRTVLSCNAPASVADATACAAVNALLTNTSFGFPKTDGTLAATLTGIAGGKTAVDGGVAQLQGGIDQLQAGLAQLAAGLKSGDPKNPGLAEGLDKLVAGLTAAVTGVTKLATGAKAAAAGSTAIAGGTAKVADGAQQVATGNSDLSSGLGQLYSGSQQLADGLGAAADGSAKLAGGLKQATDGAVKIQDGTNQLRTEAAVPLAKAGAETAAEYAENAAIMAALDEKAADGALPYGAPVGGTGTAGYDFTLAAATASTQDNTTRGIAAIVLLGLVSAAGFFVRRRALNR